MHTYRHNMPIIGYVIKLQTPFYSKKLRFVKVDNLDYQLEALKLLSNSATMRSSHLCVLLLHYISTFVPVKQVNIVPLSMSFKLLVSEALSY